jgi:threonine synthase
MTYACDACGATYADDTLIWRCARCGGTIDLPVVPFGADDVDTGEAGVWRYARALPDVPGRDRIALGEVMTPLAPMPVGGAGLRLKVDFLFPSGSYKDRGSTVMLSRLRMLGATDVFDDSSGNAGASIAAYAAAGGLSCSILTPASASPAKLAQIEAYRAQLVKIDGDRAAVAQAAIERAEQATYASHVYQPLFIAGCATAGFEIWEQLGRRAPDSVTVAVGYGSQLLGLRRAFKGLLISGAIGRLPRLYAAQSASYPALQDAWARGADDVEPIVLGTSVAEGISCRMPARGRALLASLRESGGGAVTVTDAEIGVALRDLASAGYFVEPTAAASYAAYGKLAGSGVLRDGDVHVVVLSGSGLKAGAAVAGLIREAR